MKQITITLAVSLLVLGAFLQNGNSQDFLTNGLIAYYPFNGNANDQSGSGNDGTVNGAQLTTDRFNRINSAYYFDGTSWIAMPQTRLLDGAATATISVWVVVESGTDGIVLAAGDARPLLDPFHLSFAPTKLVSLSFEDTTLGNVPNARIGYNLNDRTLTNLTIDTWHQIVVVLGRDNPLGQVTLYVDGVVNAVQIGSDGGTAFTGIAYDVGMPFLIGAVAFPGGPGGFWTGKTDDVRIYDRALSASEVQQLYSIEESSLPQRTIIPSGPYMILTWPTNYTGFTLQSTTSLGSSAVWATNPPPPVVIGGQNVVINTISGRQQFYRLSQ